VPTVSRGFTRGKSADGKDRLAGEADRRKSSVVDHKKASDGLQLREEKGKRVKMRK